MNTGRRPDLLGVFEVENRFVVDRLVEAVNAALTTLGVIRRFTPTPAMPAEST
jgi:hypothetical protein